MEDPTTDYSKKECKAHVGLNSNSRAWCSSSSGFSRTCRGNRRSGSRLGSSIFRSSISCRFHSSRHRFRCCHSGRFSCSSRQRRRCRRIHQPFANFFLIQIHPFNVSLNDIKALLNRRRIQNIDVSVAQCYHLKLWFKGYSNGTQLFDSQMAYLIVLRLCVNAVTQRSEKVNKVACSQSVEQYHIILVISYSQSKYLITYAASISFQRRPRKSNA